MIGHEMYLYFSLFLSFIDHLCLLFVYLLNWSSCGEKKQMQTQFIVTEIQLTAFCKMFAYAQNMSV